MDLLTIIIIVAILGAILGAKNPLIGGAAGFIIFPLLYYLSQSSGFLGILITAICGGILASLTGFVGSLFYSGFKGKGHNAGPSFMGGFGGGRGGAPPGGIIMSDDERKKTR